MPPSQSGGAATGGGVPPQGGSSLSGPIIRSMPEDMRRLSRPPASVSGSGKVMWPSDASVALGATPAPKEEKGGFFSSLLQTKHHDEVAPPVPPQASGQKIPVQGENDAAAKGSVWDNRVPPVHLAQQFPQSVPTPKLPLSALPIPQKPIVKPVPATPIAVPLPAAPISALPLAQKPATPTPPPVVTPVSVPASRPAPTPPAPPSSSTIFSPSPRPATPVPPSAMQAPKLPPSLTAAPVSPTPPPAAPKPLPSLRVGEQISSRPAPLPRPVTPPRPASAPGHSSPVDDSEDGIGIDLGISDYLKGGPTFQINNAPSPIPTQPQAPKPQGGIWSPPAPVKAPAPAPTPATLSAPVVPKTVPPSQTAHASPKPAQSNADLDTEKQRLTGERAQIAGARSALDAALRDLVATKQQVEDQIKPVLLRETKLANEIDDLERKEQGLSGEVRRAIERDRWTKVEERRKVEQERILIKKRLVGAEEEMHGKEEEQVSLVKREKDIDARILWIDGEYKRRDVRMKLAEVNQEKTNVESHRSILDNGIKRLKASLEETERNERRLAELKRSLAVKMPQNIAEEERFAQERFDIEKQIHDMETRRWSLEDEMKHATELFAKEDMAYLDVMHRSESLERELKGLG